MYEAETTSNIDLKIQNNLITLTPKKDWNGNTTIIITATDESGEETKSPEIQIEIVPVRDLSFTEYIEEHCTYINAIILLLILILLILTPLKNELKKKGKIALTKVKREPGYLYFVDKEGDVARTKMARGNKKNKGGRKQKQEKVGRIAKKK